MTKIKNPHQTNPTTTTKKPQTKKPQNPETKANKYRVGKIISQISATASWSCKFAFLPSASPFNFVTYPGPFTYPDKRVTPTFSPCTSHKHSNFKGLGLAYVQDTTKHLLTEDHSPTTYQFSSLHPQNCSNKQMFSLTLHKPILNKKMTEVVWLKGYKHLVLDITLTKAHLHSPNLQKIISN